MIAENHCKGYFSFFKRSNDVINRFFHNLHRCGFARSNLTAAEACVKQMIAENVIARKKHNIGFDAVICPVKHFNHRFADIFHILRIADLHYNKLAVGSESYFIRISHFISAKRFSLSLRNGDFAGTT